MEDPNAPVWAGMAYEALREFEKAANMHRLALQRARHITSILSLARFHLASKIAGANRIAAARYFAGAESFRRAHKLTSPDKHELLRFSCFELMQAAFLQDVTASPRDTVSLKPYTDELTDCVISGKAGFQTKLVSAADREAAAGVPFTIDETADFFHHLPAEQNDFVRFLPSPFLGHLAFASDSDSAVLASQLSLHRFLNDELGLPVASSIFPLLALDQAPRRSDKVSQLTAFFSEPYVIDATPIDGLPKFFVLARAWHRGRFDHFHSWYDGGHTFLLRPSDPSLAKALHVDVSELISATDPDSNRNYKSR